MLSMELVKFSTPKKTAFAVFLVGYQILPMTLMVRLSQTAVSALVMVAEALALPSVGDRIPKALRDVIALTDHAGKSPSSAKAVTVVLLA